MSRRVRNDRRRVVLQTEPSIVRQVNDLTHTLHETDRNMARNEELLSDFVEVTREQDDEISQLRDDLNRSKQLLTEEKMKRVSHRDGNAVRFVSNGSAQGPFEQQRLSNELERERLARERSDITNSRLLDALNTSLRQGSSSAATVIRDEELPVTNTRTSSRLRDHHHPGRDIRHLSRELSEERELLNDSVGENRHLSRKLGRIERTLDRIDHEKNSALSELERTSRRLDHTLHSKDELLQEISDLQDQLYQSEQDQDKLAERCDTLQRLASSNESTKEKLAKQVRHMDISLQEANEEKAILNNKYHQMKDSYLELKEEAKKLEQQCHELHNELTTDRSSIVDEVMSLNSELKDRGEANKKLYREVNSLNSQLDVSENNRRSLIGQFETLLQKLEGAESDKNHLLSHVRQLESQLQSCQEKDKATREQAVGNIKKYKSKLKHQEKLAAQFEQDHSAALQQVEFLTAQVQQCQIQLQNENQMCRALEEENVELKTRMTEYETTISDLRMKHEELATAATDLNTNLTHTKKALELAREELTAEREKNEQTLADKIQLTEELAGLREEVTTVTDNIKAELDHVTQQKNKEISKLEKELGTLQSQNGELSKKLAKSTRAYQGVKVQLATSKREEHQSKDEMQKLQQQLLQLEQSCNAKEQELRMEMEELQIMHLNEIEQLTKAHEKQVTELENQISKLQVLLADERSTVRAVKRQQFKMFDDQYKFGDDLSQSLEDTEKLRRKYMKAKRFYEEKVASLEREQVEIKDEENDRLRLQLQELHKKIVQQAEDHEAVLRATSAEMDGLVQKVGQHINMPVFPASTNSELDSRKWIADTLAKLQWLKKETGHLLSYKD
ncbi:centrosomal protein of 128 kDa-like [Dysidea avara]|uniref:centrosomal protein of 128 kDa-like n=1 Tax=Dysidea avara TaxID=196820 RepID=UPI00331CF4C5